MDKSEKMKSLLEFIETLREAWYKEIIASETQEDRANAEGHWEAYDHLVGRIKKDYM